MRESFRDLMSLMRNLATCNQQITGVHVAVQLKQRPLAIFQRSSWQLQDLQGLIPQLGAGSISGARRVAHVLVALC